MRSGGEEGAWVGGREVCSGVGMRGCGGAGWRGFVQPPVCVKCHVAEAECEEEDARREEGQAKGQVDRLIGGWGIRAEGGEVTA